MIGDDSDDPITLAEACRITGLPLSRLRLQSARGRLGIFRIGSRDYTTVKDLQSMLRPAIPQSSTEVVYFIECGEFIKIGRTSDIDRRVKSLSRHTPSDLKVLATIPGDHTTEYDFHTRFFASRHKGEWFHKSGDLLAFIKEIAA